MSGPHTAAALAQARAQLQDEKLQRDLHKLHLSHQHSFLPWKHLSAAHLTQLASLPSVAQRRATLTHILGLEAKFPLGQVSRRDPLATAAQRREAEEAERVEQDPNLTRREIFVDLALSVLGFCWSQELSALKTSTFFSILLSLHEFVSDRPGGGAPISLAAATDFFDTLLLRHSIERPPFSICCFSAPDVLSLSRFATSSYLRHLKLYQYVYGTGQHLDLRVRNSAAERVERDWVGIPTPPPPAAPTPPPSGGEEGATDGAVAGATGAGAQVVVVSPPAPASTAPSTAAGASPLPTVASSDWWNLDHASNYFPHTSPFQLHGALPLPTRGTVLSPSPEDEAQAGRVAGEAEEEDGEEFKDSAEVAQFLESQSLATESAAAHIAEHGAAADSGVPLLADPEEQALFDAAMARELGALQRDFGAQLRAQQEAFAKRIGELEAAAPAGAGGLGAGLAAGLGQASGRGSLGGRNSFRARK